MVYALVQYILPKLRLQVSVELSVRLYVLCDTGQFSNRAHLGVLTQLAIVFGIMLTQVAGITLATPSTWRFVFFVSFTISTLQFLLGSMIVESPTWLLNQRRPEDHKHAVRRLWGDVEEPLLNQLEETPEVSPQECLTVPQVFATTGLKKPLMIVALAMISQQLSGKITFSSSLAQSHFE